MVHSSSFRNRFGTVGLGHYHGSDPFRKWVTLKYFSVKLHFFISWHMTFKAHFCSTVAPYHGPDSLWKLIFSRSNCTFFISWHMTFMAHFHNTWASYHRPDSFWKWYIKLIFKAQEHLKLTMGQIPFGNGWPWKWVTLSQTCGEMWHSQCRAKNNMYIKLIFITQEHLTVNQISFQNE